MSEETPDLAQYLAGKLDECADELVSEWLDWVQSGMVGHAASALPRKELLDHVPPVLRSLTQYLTNPTHAVRSETLGHLKIHGQIRRDQGYSASTIMAEFDGLSHLVFDRMQDEVEQSGYDWPVHEVLQAFNHLSEGLRSMTFVTLSIFEQVTREREEQLSSQLSQFGRAIGHELKTPLQSISLGVEALALGRQGAHEQPKEREAEQLRVIKSALQHANGLINDIEMLALSQQSVGGRHLVAVERILQDTVDLLARQAGDQEVDIQVTPELPPVAIEQSVGTLALVNLVSNAVKYADPEKPERWVKIDAQVIDQEETTPVLEISVEDNGLGIPAELQGRVFQQYFRAHPEHAEGTGLGLAITQQLVNDRGGNLSLESVEGRGTRAVLRMRAIDVSADIDEPAEPERVLSETIRRRLDDEAEDDA